MANSNLITLFLLLIISYTILYFRGRKYLEHFNDKRFNPDGSPNENMVIYPPEKPYLLNEIDDLDDYELSQVFQNQGSKEASKKQISDAMTRYPLDWSVQGPASQHFQDNQIEYEKKKEDALPGYTAMDSALPDSTAMEAEELKILQTYKPESSKGLLQYSVDDVKSLLEKLYLKKGLIPVIEQSKQGQNIWEITELKEKDPKIVWEDEVETERQKMKNRGEEVIEVPYTASDVAAGLDPFFQARQSPRDGKYDYTKFTPGLERMFAPTYPIKSWA